MVRGQDLKVQGAEQFGYALAADGNTIAVGSPDELIDRTGVRGAVYLYSASTLRYTRIHQRSKGVYTCWLSRFGHSVDLLDGRLVIGAPNADVGSHNGAGRVHLLRWNETKRTYSVVRSFSQATKGVPGAARDNDALGSTVVIARGLTASSSYDVVAAAMYDQLDDLKTAGSLTVTNFDKGGYRLITQDSPGVPSTPKRQGMFGWTLAVRNDGLRTSAVLASPSQLDHPDTDGWAVVQTSPGRLNTWNFLWPSTTGHTYQYGYSITG